jgi:hypothetical protein
LTNALSVVDTGHLCSCTSARRAAQRKEPLSGENEHTADFLPLPGDKKTQQRGTEAATGCNIPLHNWLLIENAGSRI